MYESPEGAPTELDDGARIHIRRFHSADKELYLSAFERLGEQSRYTRFLAPTPHLSDRMVSYLTQLDHHDHEALIAIDDESGDVIGLARYVRDPQRPELAELAMTVADDWQHRGVGHLLLWSLCARAREDAIERFTATMLATNWQMMELLKELGPVQIVSREAGVVEAEVAIPPMSDCLDQPVVRASMTSGGEAEQP
jgi:GNAT superfamily N-acetyltransferase